MRACFAGDCCVNGMHAAAALAVSVASPTRVVLVVVDVVVGTVPAQYAWRVRVSIKLLRRTTELHSRFAFCDNTGISIHYHHHHHRHPRHQPLHSCCEAFAPLRKKTVPSPLRPHKQRTFAELVDFGSRTILVRTNFRSNATPPCSPCKQRALGCGLATLHALRQGVVPIVLHLEGRAAQSLHVAAPTSAVTLVHNH